MTTRLTFPAGPYTAGAIERSDNFAFLAGSPGPMNPMVSLMEEVREAREVLNVTLYLVIDCLDNTNKFFCLVIKQLS